MWADIVTTVLKLLSSSLSEDSLAHCSCGRSKVHSGTSCWKRSSCQHPR